MDSTRKSSTATLRGQGATEYLVVLGIVLMVGLISISLVGENLKAVPGTAETSSQLYWQGETRPFRIPEAMLTNDSKFQFVMENSDSDSVSLTGLSVNEKTASLSDGVAYANSSAIYFGPGEKKLVGVDLGAGNFNCREGQMANMKLRLTYLTQFGTEKTQTSDKGFLIKCNINSGNGGAESNSTGNQSGGTLMVLSNRFPDATVGQYYETGLLSASGGVPPYHGGCAYAPEGLAFNYSNGVMYGTPTKAWDEFTCPYTIWDSAGHGVRFVDPDYVPPNFASPEGAVAKIRINTPQNLIITTGSLPNGNEGQPYSVTLAASGGTPPYVWGYTEGPLPTGISLNQDGVLSGTPAVGSNGQGNVRYYQPVIYAEDQNSQRMNKIMGFYIGTYGGSMNASQVVITTPTQLPDMVVGSAYSIILTAENGTPPYVWSASDGRQLLGIDYLAIDPDGRVWASAENTSLVSPGGSGSTGILVHDAAGSFAIKGIQIRTVNATG